MIEPCNDFVLVKPAPDEKSKGGIIMVQGDQAQRPSKGVVVAVGPGKYENGFLVPMRTPKGSTVWFQQYPNVDIYEGGEKYVMVREAQVCCVVKG
jgi:chaperonin GroES